MPILAILLLFVSASLHSIWNFLLKQSEEKYIAMGWQVILSGIVSAILLFFTGLPPRSMWPFALASGILEAIYFLLLSYAYTDHDFSLVYPIARGSAPALLVLWSALFLRERLTAGGYLGLAMITGGIRISSPEWGHATENKKCAHADAFFLWRGRRDSNIIP